MSKNEVKIALDAAEKEIAGHIEYQFGQSQAHLKSENRSKNKSINRNSMAVRSGVIVLVFFWVWVFFEYDHQASAGNDATRDENTPLTQPETLNRTHVNWEETVESPEFKNWFKQQPVFVQDFKHSLRVDDAIDLLDRFYDYKEIVRSHEISHEGSLEQSEESEQAIRDIGVSIENQLPWVLDDLTVLEQVTVRGRELQYYARINDTYRRPMKENWTQVAKQFIQESICYTNSPLFAVLEKGAIFKLKYHDDNGDQIGTISFTLEDCK